MLEVFFGFISSISGHVNRYNLAAALTWAFSKCPLIDALAVSGIEIRLAVAHLPVIKQLRRIYLGTLCDRDELNKYFKHAYNVNEVCRALSKPNQTDLEELTIVGTPRCRLRLDRDLAVVLLLRRHAATLRSLKLCLRTCYCNVDRTIESHATNGK